MTIGPHGEPPRSSEPLCVRITWCTGATSGGEDETMGGVIYGQPREPPPSRTLMRTPFVKRHTPPQSGFWLFFRFPGARRRRSSVACSALLSVFGCPPDGGTKHCLRFHHH